MVLRKRIATAAALSATAITTAAATASAAPKTPSHGCTWPSGNITYGSDSSVPALAAWATGEAANAWSLFTNVNFSAVDPARANIRVRSANLPAGKAGRADWACSNGKFSGQVVVTLDPGFVASASLDRLRLLASHELGHAIGLDHNETIEGTCWGVPRPASVMYSLVDSSFLGDNVCGSTIATTPDIEGANALYKG